MHNYKLRYDINIEDKPEGYSKNEADGKGLTDGLLTISILFPDDGSYSQAVVAAYNGRENRPFTQDEVFKIWMTLGLSLHDTGQLTGWRKEAAHGFADGMRRLFKSDQV
jgi:hypothetical protein